MRYQVGAVAAVALGTVLWWDLLRAWLPSILFVYGRAGTTPPQEMGAFAALPFLLALGAAVALRWLPLRPFLLGAGAVLVVARLALQGTTGGDAQLWVSTVGVFAALLWLAALAGGAISGRVAALGLPLGLLADMFLHSVLRSTGAVWRAGAGWWLLAVVLGVAFLGALWVSRPAERVSPARAWFAVGSVFLLHGWVTGLPSRVHTLTDWPEPAAAAVVLIAYALGVAGAWQALRGGHMAGPAGGALVLLGLAAALAGTPALVAAGHIALPVGAGVTVAALLGQLSAPRPWVAALGMASGMVVFLALAFGYAAAYDMAMPVSNETFLAVAAALLAGLAATTPAVRTPAVSEGSPAPMALALAAAVVLGAGAVAVAADRPRAETGDGFPVRIALYNLQMGFDIHGHHAVDEQARVLAEHRPELVALNEVSRGWLTNASTDTLPRLAQQLEMGWVFAPAADRVWGNALLTRYPVVASSSELLPLDGTIMQRSVLSVVVDVGGQELGVVVTHADHRAGTEARRAQLEVVAQEARRMADAGLPVVLIGDLNAEPGDPDMEPIESWMEDASAPYRPVATWPSWAPEVHIDHVFVTPDLEVTEYVVPETTASDHLPVVVTVQRR